MEKSYIYVFDNYKKRYQKERANTLLFRALDLERQINGFYPTEDEIFFIKKLKQAIYEFNPEEIRLIMEELFLNTNKLAMCADKKFELSGCIFEIMTYSEFIEQHSGAIMRLSISENVISRIKSIISNNLRVTLKNTDIFIDGLLSFHSKSVSERMKSKNETNKLEIKWGIDSLFTPLG
jgi:hypothetical protein